MLDEIITKYRPILLRSYSSWLTHEELEDCFQESCIEIWKRHQKGDFKTRLHLKNALEQKFLSRIRDQRRAINGRTKIRHAEHTAHRDLEPSDFGSEPLHIPTPSLERQVIARENLRELFESVACDRRNMFSFDLSSKREPLNPVATCKRRTRFRTRHYEQLSSTTRL